MVTNALTKKTLTAFWNDWRTGFRWSHWSRNDFPIEPLVTFRVVFGVLMLFSTLRFIYLGWIEDHFVHTKFQFKYFGFEWVPLLDAPYLYILHGILCLAAIGITLGFFYRISATLFFFGFTYTQLIDLTYYLNHYYFVSVVSFLLIFLPAHQAYAWDSRKNPVYWIPFWPVGLLRWQVALLYVYAGLAKINVDWLFHALPLKIWLPAADSIPLVGSIFAHDWAPWVFSWGGMLYDSFIPFFLMNRITRWPAYFFVWIFHIAVGLLFQIGVFPIVMIGLTPLFFSADWHQKILSKIKKKTETSVNLSKFIRVPKWVWFYLGFQLIFPWRYLLYPGNLFWTEEGYRFSWRVMLMEKAGTATFYVKDPKTGREGVVDNSEFLRPHQEKQMAMQPDMVLQFAHFLAEHYQKEGMPSPEVRAEVYVTFNGRPSQLLLDPTVNLARISDSWQHKKWLMPAPTH
ncbi:MAG: HTTM domain-containing protein [Spirosomataceae bacterium]